MAKPPSALTNSAAVSSGLFPVFAWLRIRLANGSSPASRAFDARVARFFLKGLYKSSTRCMTVAPSMDARSSLVSFPCSSMELRISALRASRLRRYVRRSSRVRSCVSSRPPVASLRYRAMKGMVLPSSISLVTDSICAGETESSCAMVRLMSSIYAPASLGAYAVWLLHAPLGSVSGDVACAAVP